MFNVFGSDHSEVGLLDLNLILNTAGKIKIRYGSKFIDLLDDKGNINTPFPKIVVKISSKDQMKSNCFYLLDDVLYLKYQDSVIEVSNQKVGYLEYTNSQELTEELIKTAQNNIGLTYDSTNNIPIKDGIIFVGSKIYKVDSGNLSEYLKEPLESINKLEKLPNLNNSVIAWNKSSWTYVPMITIEEYNEFKTSISLKFLELAKNNDTPIYPFDSVLYSDKVYTVTEFKPELEHPVYTGEGDKQSIEKYQCSGANINSVPTLDLLSGSIVIMTASGNEGVITTNQTGEHINISDNIISYVFTLKYNGNGEFIFLDSNNNPVSYDLYLNKYNKETYYMFKLPDPESSGNYINIYFKKEQMFANNNLFIKLDTNISEKFRIDYGNSLIGIEENKLEGNEIKVTPHVVLGDLDDSKKFYNDPAISFRTYNEKTFKLGIYSDQAVFNGAEFRGRWPNETIEPETLDYPRYSKKLSEKLKENFKPTEINDDNKQVIPDINWIMKYILVPKGVIVMWSGNSESVPDGWVICNGENGTPDLRDKFIVGAGSEYSVGSTGGEKEITLTIELIPAHDHTLNLSGKVLSGSGEWNFYHGDENVYLSTELSSVTTSSVGGGDSHENRPPYYALYYIMKIK